MFIIINDMKQRDEGSGMMDEQLRAEQGGIADNPIARAASLIRDARRMAVITGAGMSVDSGVNDFRSRSGWWRNIDPRTVATVEALEHRYDLFHEF